VDDSNRHYVVTTLVVLFFDKLTDEADHFIRFGVTSQLFLREDEFVVHADLEAASVRGKEFQRFDLALELTHQVTCQAHGPVSVVSNRTILDRNF
jgi:hypothetical protein